MSGDQPAWRRQAWAVLGVAAALALANPASPARGQSREPPGAAARDGGQEAKPEPPKPEPPPPPYEGRLLRLAEIMGALSYLQPLCAEAANHTGSEIWRESMRQLLDAEAKTPRQRARLAGAYNVGFRGYEATYRTCTGNARLVIARFLAEGEKIARDVANRFGGG